MKFVGLTPLRLTEGGLVVMQPVGRFMIGSYHCGAALIEMAERAKTAIEGSRRFFFIAFVGLVLSPEQMLQLGRAAVRLFETFQYSKSGK